MTPERAAELAKKIAKQWKLGNMVEFHIRDEILAACAEQRETDAKIADDYAKNAGNMYARRSGRSVADRLRSAE